MAGFSTYLGSHRAQIKVQFSSGIIGPLPSFVTVGRISFIEFVRLGSTFSFSLLVTLS